MATYDNKHWLLSHIRNSFISTDDTRMCEIVLAGENFPKLLYNRAQERREALIAKAKEKTDKKEPFESSTEWREPVSEYDPYPDLEESVDDMYILNGSYIRHEDFGPYRQRSNTAQWLEKKEQAMKKAAKTRNFKWDNPQINLTDEEKEDLLKEKELTDEPKNKTGKTKSLLSERLEQYSHMPHQQYLEYAKFDGTAMLNQPTKTFKIFMTMLPEDQQNYPLNICVIATAKIQDVIGFTCFCYSVSHPDANLGPASNYVLCIAEDDGEVDLTFPCLDSNEPCSKFGFTCFGLVELKSKIAQTHITSSIPEDSTLINAFPMLYSKHGEGAFNRMGDSRNTTGGSGTYDAAIRALNAAHAEKKVASASLQDNDLDKINSHILATEAPQYKCYSVEISNKVRANTNVQLGVSLERIEIEPVFTMSHKFWPKKKYISYNIDSVAWCQIVETKGNKTVFKLVHSANSNASTTSTPKSAALGGFSQQGVNYKHHYFECDHETAKEIVEKIKRILSLKNSACYCDYKAARERKLQTRRSFHSTKV